MDLIQPMEPILCSSIKSGQGWIHQVKWDGIRGLSYIEHGRLQVFTKHGRERTEFYPEIQQCMRLLKADQAVLDGEMIVFDDTGRPSFHRVLTREKLRTVAKLDYYRHQYPLYYIIFDLLYLNGRDIRRLQLTERRAILRDILNPNERVILADDYEDGAQLLKLMKERQMEGIVSKRLAGLYRAGKKHHDWFKIKITRKMLTVIGGLILKDGNPNSLLIGINRDNKLIYVGKVAIGLTQENILEFKNHITKYKSSAVQERSPFANMPSEPSVVWLKPLLTCWVQFLEWTEHGGLRHPVMMGFSNQKPQEALGKEYFV